MRYACSDSERERHRGLAFVTLWLSTKDPSKMKVHNISRDAASADSETGGSPAAHSSAASPEFDSSVSAYDMAVAEINRLLGAWLTYEPGARLGRDAEELHQLRVTARRIDATLALFKRHLPQRLVRARKMTKAVLRSLGAARDLDVQLEELARYCAALPSHERAAAEPLRTRLTEERLQARARMLRGLDAEPTRYWLETLSLAGTPAREPESRDSAIAVVPERVRQRFRKLKKSVARLSARSTMDDYHRVRRRAKQLRYAIECSVAMLGKPAEDLLKSLRRLQDGLGANQDAYMAQQRLVALTAESGAVLPPATLFLMGRIAESHARNAAQARQTLARRWRKVAGGRWKALRARIAELNAAAMPQLLAPVGPQSPEPVAPLAEPRPLRH
jgi:CHAD domain-containing protein